MTATVRPIRATVYDEAMRGALSAGLNWPVKLRHAQVLSSSDNPTHRTLAEHVRTSASLHEAGLLVAVPPPKRDLLPKIAAPETPRDVAKRHADRWPQIVAGGVVGALVLLQLSGWGV